MKTRLSRLAAVIALATLPVSGAQACWSEAAETAAKIRDMDTMLLVSSLRCRLTGSDFLTNYNGFVRESRVALTQANDTLRAHFAKSGGINAYDRFVTSIANRYGGGAEGLKCSDMESILSAARAEGGSYTGLARLARDAGAEPILSGGLCTVAVATRQ